MSGADDLRERLEDFITAPSTKFERDLVAIALEWAAEEIRYKGKMFSKAETYRLSPIELLDEAEGRLLEIAAALRDK